MPQGGEARRRGRAAGGGLGHLGAGRLRYLDLQLERRCGVLTRVCPHGRRGRVVELRVGVGERLCIKSRIPTDF